MLDFAHPNLFWIAGVPALAVIAVPVLIHLINMLRHRRVDWAAMEFLLVSQKKNRTWIVLKQLLLLLMRMAAVATVVYVLAQPRLHNRFGHLFGTTETHHIVLLDDSFSMSDRWADTSAFGEAKRVVQQIGAAAARPTQPQTFTLLRFSGVARGARPDLFKQRVDKTDFRGELEEVLEKIEVSEASAGPMEAVRSIGQLLGHSGDQRRIVYVISDFRAREWDDPGDLQRQLLQLSEADAEIHLINSVEKAQPNLAIASLAPAEGIRAAGVPWFMEVAVQNFGDTAAREVSVLLEEDGHARPAVTIAEIPAGRRVTERFLVHFPTAGRHQATARLESDAVPIDNFRYGTVEVPIDVPVLLVDGSPDARDARYVSVASAPGGQVRTGINPQIETPAYLNLKRPLEEFRAIVLTNVERLDPAAVTALEQYVAAGGGLAIFLGERCRSKFINDELYRDGEGVFPLPLVGPRELLVDRLQRAPDLQVEPHPIFRIFSGKRNSFLAMVIVERYFAAPDGWQPDPDSTTRVIARLRNGAPLAVERRFGEGRVVAFLSSAAPDWNNWARNPSFVVAMQDLQAYLSGRSAGEVSRRVGTQLRLELDPQQYQPQVRFVTPREDASPTAMVDAVPTEDSLAVSFSDTVASGLYEALLTRTDGKEEIRRYAFNVEADEGNLKALSGEQLAARLEGVNYVYKQASMFQYTVGEGEGNNVWEWLLGFLILLLIGEQILAWSASYHPTARQGVTPVKGGVR